MREILFKAKRIDNGEWVEGGYVHRTDYYGGKCDKHYVIDGTETDGEGYGEHYLVDKDTLCQYTGLTDKNGNKIWENDVVKGTFFGFLMPEENYVGEICWQENISGWGSNYWHSDIEVICNIFDNPELLKGEQS